MIDQDKTKEELAKELQEIRLECSRLKALVEKNVALYNPIVDVVNPDNKRLQDILKWARIGLWEWDKETDTVYWSEKLYHIAGLDSTRPAPCYAKHAHIYTPQSWDLLKTAVENTLQTGEPYQLRLDMIRPDGTLRNLMAYGGAKYDESQQKIIGLFGLVQDETEHKKAARALKESEINFEKVVNTMMETFSIITENGDFIYANTHAANNLSGGKSDNVIGRNIRDFVPPNQANELIETYRRVISTKQPVQKEIKVVLTGSEKWFLNTLQFIQWGPEKSPAILSISLDITQGKSIENQLRLSEERNSLLSSVTMEGILIHKNGVAKDLNKALANMLGYEREELLNKDFFEIVHADDHALARENIVKEHASPYEIRAIRKDGDLLNLEVESKNFYHKDEKWRVSAFRDITARKQAEELKRTMGEMLNLAPGSITVLDTTGRFLYANQKTFELHGYTEAEFMALNLHQLDVPATEAMLSERFRQIEQSGYASFEAAHYHKDGHEIPMEIFARTVSWRGQPAILSIATDMTGRKKADEALRVSDEKMRRIYSVAPAGIGVVTNRVLKDVNPLVCEMTGYTKEELLEKSTRILYPSQEEYDLVGKEKDAQIIEKRTGKVETRWQKKDGTIINILLAFTPIDKNDRSEKTIFTALDITERKRAEVLIQKKTEEIEAQNEEYQQINEELNQTNQELAEALERIEESDRLLTKIADNYPNSYVSVINKDLTVGFSGGQEFTRQNLNPDDFIGLTLEQVFGEFAGIVRENYLKTFNGKETTFELFINNQYQLYKTVPLYDEHHHIPRILSVVENITERKLAEQELKRIEWLLTSRPQTSKGKNQTYTSPYGDLVTLNTSRLILDSVGEHTLTDIVGDYLNLLDTSAAVYEKNGDYALGIFSSGWCRFMDSASRAVCGTNDNREALDCGRWLCHESCWSHASKTAIETGQPADIECSGGIHLYAVPIVMGNEIIGAINFGYGDPPRDESKLRELAAKYQVNYEELRAHALNYESRPPYIIDLAKQRLVASARLISDITGRRLAEKELLVTKEKAVESEERYRALYNNAPLSYQSLDAKGCFNDVNPMWLKTLGYDRSEVIGKWFGDFLHPDYKEHFAINFPAFKLRGYVSDVQFKLRKKDGNFIHVSFEGCVGYTPEGSFKQTYCVFKDITDQKEAEQRLIKSEERYALVIEASEQGIWDWNIETNEVFYSEQWKKQIGYEDHELKNEFNTWVDHLHPDDREMCQHAVSSYLKQPIAHLMLEFRFRHKDGTYRWIHNKAASLKNAEGKVIRLFGIHTDITESKLSQAIFKDIVEKNPMSIQILDIEGYPIQINSAHTNLFGVKPPSGYSVLKDTQLLAMGFGDLFERIKKGEVVYFPDSYYNVHDVDPSFPDSPIWVKALGFTLNDNNGHPNKIVLMHENITERKNAEALLNDIIEKNPLSIQIVSKKGYSLHGNPAFIRLFGAMPPPEFSILDDLKTKSPELEKLISRVKNGEIVHLPDIYFNAHDSVPEAPDIPLWLRALIFPLNDSSGKPERFVFMHENITDGKVAEQELIKAKEKAEESKLRFKSIIENAPDGVVIIDAQGKFTYGSPNATRHFGYTEEDIIGRSGNEYTHPDDLPVVLQALETIFYNPHLKPKLKYRFRRKNGDYRWIETTFSNLLSDKAINGIVLNFADVTEREQMVEELIIAKEKAEESDRLKSAFLANMSHEIRTPMNGILGFADLLKEPSLSGDEQQEYIRIIEKSGARMLNIINEIVDISKIEAGLMETNIRETNVNEIMDFAYRFFKPEVESKGMSLLFQGTLKTNDAIIKTDKEKLNAILFNLIKNAIKYTKQGFVEFGYSLKTFSDQGNLPAKEELEFFVKDTGIGIPTDRQEAIFERFIQADVLDKNAMQGAGLGLSISKAYVEMLGGHIRVESQEGSGTTFYFTLPYNTDKHTDGSPTYSDSKVQSTNDIKSRNRELKILIVEDDEASELYISEAVKGISTGVLRAATGIEAVKYCQDHPDIDLVLIDIRMPEMDGYTAIRRIREFNKQLLIIAQTAYGLAGDREKALEAGANDYIAKPIKKNDLLSLIQKYFK